MILIFRCDEAGTSTNISASGYLLHSNGCLYTSINTSRLRATGSRAARGYQELFITVPAFQCVTLKNASIPASAAGSHAKVFHLITKAISPQLVELPISWAILLNSFDINPDTTFGQQQGFTLFSIKIRLYLGLYHFLLLSPSPILSQFLKVIFIVYHEQFSKN